MHYIAFRLIYSLYIFLICSVTSVEMQFVFLNCLRFVTLAKMSKITGGISDNVEPAISEV